MNDSKCNHTIKGRVRGCLAILFILLTGLYGSIFIYGPILPLVFLWPWLFRRLTEVLVSAWQTSVVVAAMIFLDRTWETDQQHISNILSYFVELESKPNILFFPEGTDLSESNKRKSKQYAKQKGLPEFDYVLQPRTTGFTCFVNTLRDISGIHAVHDVTVAYPYNIPVSEINLLNGDFPREVHFHIRRYSIDQLPQDPAKLGKWCQEKWEQKEEMLRKFYSESKPNLRKFNSKRSPPYHPRSFGLWLSLFLWFLFSAVCSWLLYAHSIARWYAATICLFYVIVAMLFGEFAKMEMLLYDMFKKPRRLWGVRATTESNSKSDHRNSKTKNEAVYDKYRYSR